MKNVNEPPKKGQVILVNDAYSTKTKRVKVVRELPITRHYLVRDSKGREFSMFTNPNGEIWLCPED